MGDSLAAGKEGKETDAVSKRQCQLFSRSLGNLGNPAEVSPHLPAASPIHDENQCHHVMQHDEDQPPQPSQTHRDVKDGSEPQLLSSAGKCLTPAAITGAKSPEAPKSYPSQAEFPAAVQGGDCEDIVSLPSGDAVHSRDSVVPAEQPAASRPDWSTWTASKWHWFKRGTR